MVIFFGPAGSGKSTQGEIFAEKYGWKWLSVGELLREKQALKPELVDVMKSGEMVDTDFVIRMMSEAIAEIPAGGGAVLDGYPREIRQAEYVAEHDAERIQAAVVIDGDREALLGRLMLRGRADDSKETVAHRFEFFDESMKEILPVLERAGMPILKVDCVGTIEEVTERIEGVMREAGVL
jgi:adenylate kinase